MSFFAPPKDPRIEQIESSFFYWSIKYGKIMFISANRIKTLKRCNLCIPKYRPGTYKECDFTFSTLNSFKRHVLSCEFKFKRPLMWANSKSDFDFFKNLTNCATIFDLINSTASLHYRSTRKSNSGDRFKARAWDRRSSNFGEGGNNANRVQSQVNCEESERDGEIL